MSTTSTPATNGPSTGRLDIAIVGGGIAGLTLAIGLIHKGLHVTLYEAAHAFSEIGAGVSFGPNAQRAMSLIDPRIEDGFKRRATYNAWESKRGLWFDFRVGEEAGLDDGQGGVLRAGELVHELPCQGGQCSVHRAHFLDELVALVPEGVAHFGKRLEELEDRGDGVVLRFHDGSEARHQAVVGCDGIKSRTRVILLGEEDKASYAIFTGKYAYRGLIPMDKACEVLGEELARNSQLYMGHHGHMLTFPIEAGKTMNVVAFSTKEDGKWEDEQWVKPMNKEDMYHDFDGWSSPVRHILDMLQKPDVWALFNHPPCDTYYKGRVCMMGDAAHASTPHQGAGAGMAVEDAYVLSNLLAAVDKPEDVEKAFRAFDAIRRPRTQKLVTTSQRGAELYEFEDPEVRDNVPKMKERLNTRMDWIWGINLKEHLAEAMKILKDS